MASQRRSSGGWRTARFTNAVMRADPDAPPSRDTPLAEASVNMNHVAKFEALISEMKADGRYRTFVELERIAGQFPAALLRGRDGRSRRVTVWCSNDYLGMGQHPDVLAAMHDAIGRFGSGTGGTRNISGTNRQHVELEAELADLHGKEAALIFTSGGISNLAALGTLGRLLPDCSVFSDALNHNTLTEGTSLSGPYPFPSHPTVPPYP